VGAVVTACLARGGHSVTGVDTDAAKAALVNAGRAPIIEEGLEALLTEGVQAGRVRATTDSREAVLTSDVSLICVGTPSRPTGEIDLTYVERVCGEIGRALREKSGPHLVVVRSTLLPGSVEGTVLPVLEGESGRKLGPELGVAINPEFLREGTALEDFFHPALTVVGAVADRDFEQVAELYRGLSAPVVRTTFKVAEMMKYVNNVFHALKITFGNEIGAICHRLGVDGREVMDLLCQDTKLNLSPVYLRPGFAYGGSCLPKDLRALCRLAQAQEVEVPLLRAIGASNERQVQAAVERIVAQGRRRIGVLGFAFKGGTDDLRESPVVTLVETLLGKGYELKLYDARVSLARLVGANRRFIEQRIPHLSRLMVEQAAELVAHAEVVIIGNQSAGHAAILAGLRPDQVVIDLTPAARVRPATPARYERICG
jgi:GDP-mannose 6-dehydrogenase